MLYRKIKDPLTGEESFREIPEQEVRNIIEDAVKTGMKLYVFGEELQCSGCGQDISGDIYGNHAAFPEIEITNKAIEQLKKKR